MLTASHDERPASAVLTSTMHSFNSHSGNSATESTSSTFNYPEDYCHICQKHFCNKYYLKKHKVDVHGLLPKSQENLSQVSISLPANHKKTVSRKQQRHSMDGENNKTLKKVESSALMESEGPLQSTADEDNSKTRFDEIFNMVKNSQLASPMVQSSFNESSQDSSFGFLLGANQLGASVPQQSSSSSSPMALLMSYLSRSNPAALCMSALAAAATGYNSPMNNPLLFSAAMSFLAAAAASRPGISDSFPSSSGQPPRSFPANSSSLFSQNIFQQYLNHMNSTGSNSSDVKSNSGDQAPLHEYDGRPNSTSTPSSKHYQTEAAENSPEDRCDSPQDLSQLSKALHSTSTEQRMFKLENYEELKDDLLCDDPPMTSALSSTTVDTFRNSMMAAKLAERVVCDICHKEVCNKYFLKTHKLKVHKVATSSFSSEAEDHCVIGSGGVREATESPEVTKTSANDLLDASGMTADKIMDNFYSAALSCLSINSLNSQTAPELSVETSHSDQISQLHEEDEPTLRRSVQFLGKKRRKFSEAFCHICNKEVCSKYFLRTHLLNVHGIHPSANHEFMETATSMTDIDIGVTHRSETRPHDPPGTSSVSPPSDDAKMDRLDSTLASVIAKIQQSLEEENLFPTKSSHSSTLFPAIRTKVSTNNSNYSNKKYSSSSTTAAQPVGANNSSSSHPNKVLCDICNKWICNKYFLRTHKLNRHGYVTPSPTAIPNTPLGNRSENEENTKQAGSGSQSSSVCNASLQETVTPTKNATCSLSSTIQPVSTPSNVLDTNKVVSARGEHAAEKEDILDAPINLSCRDFKTQPPSVVELAGSPSIHDVQDNIGKWEGSQTLSEANIDEEIIVDLQETNESIRSTTANERAVHSFAKLSSKQMRSAVPYTLSRRFSCSKCPARFHHRYLLMKHSNLKHSHSITKHL